MSTGLLVSTGAVSCYPASMVNLMWFANENVYRVSTEQHGDMKSGVQQSKNTTILQAWCASALTVLLEHVKVQLSPQTHKCNCFACLFVAATVKLQKFVINEQNFSPSEQGSN